MSVNTKRVFYVKYLSHSRQSVAEHALGMLLLDALDGKRPPRIVNPEAWPHYARRFERAFGLTPGQAERRLAGE